jgi:hypothetical protein
MARIGDLPWGIKSVIVTAPAGGQNRYLAIQLRENKTAAVPL